MKHRWCVLAGACLLASMHGVLLQQARSIKIDYTSARAWVRSAAVYHQVRTVLLITALPLTEEVQEVYQQLYATRRGELFSYSFSPLNHCIAFYILVSPTSRSSPMFSLTDPRALWQIYLKNDNETILPQAITLVNLEPEYRLIIGNHAHHFRDVYLVTFPLPHQTTQHMELMCCSAKHMVGLQWALSPRQMAPKNPYNKVHREQR